MKNGTVSTMALPVRTTESISDEVERMQERIRERAYDLFESNGRIDGSDLDNWLQAEREIVWTPSIELRENNDGLLLNMQIPGVEAKDLDIRVTSEEILVTAALQPEHNGIGTSVVTSELVQGFLFGVVNLPRKIEPEYVKAELREGMLLVTAPVDQQAAGKTDARKLLAAVA